MLPGFNPRHSIRCEDCEIRGDLDEMGRTRFKRRRSTRNRPEWGDRSFDAGWHGCETCGGTGRISLKGVDQLDPYASKRK